VKRVYQIGKPISIHAYKTNDITVANGSDES
jgi:hypothetical protein